MSELKRGKGRPAMDVIAPKITVGREQQEQVVELAENRAAKVSVLYRQALAIALPQMAKWRRYTSSECEGLTYAPDVMTKPEKYNVVFSDSDILAAGFNTTEFGEYLYSALIRAFGQHKKGSRVIIAPQRETNDIAIEL